MLSILHCTCHCSVYKHLGYAQVVSGLAEETMQAAVEEVKKLPHYATAGEVLELDSMTSCDVFVLFVVGHY